jgi:hypothetical protein
MVWSAAGTLLGDSPPGNEFVSCLGYTAHRPIGRATGGSAGNETQGGLLPSAWGKTKEVSEI